MKKVLTTCGYCGCGCNLYLTVEGGRITGVLPKPDHPVSQGMLCSKGGRGTASRAIPTVWISPCSVRKTAR